MMLYERGHFQLNDPVSDYLPEFAEPQVAVAFDARAVRLSARPHERLVERQRVRLVVARGEEETEKKRYRPHQHQYTNVNCR